MRTVILAVALTTLTAAPLLAQSERGYLDGAGGFVASPDRTSGDLLLEGGVRIAPHLLVFGDLGRFHDLQPSDVQPLVDSATSQLLANQGLGVTGTGRVPATYSIGGLRYERPATHHVAPYVLGGIGMARLMPTAHFAFASGTLPDGTTASVGDDVTNQVISTGAFITPTPTNAFMFSLGGGVDVPMAKHWMVDAGYRFSRVKADTPLNAQGATFGFGYRF